MSESSGGAAPLAPRNEGLAAQFHAWLSAGELRVQRCGSCGRRRHVPRHLCPVCGSDDASWVPCSGRGQIWSWTTTYRALHPAFAAVPFTTGVVALDEGPRIVAPLIGFRESDLRIGLPVQLQIQTHPGGLALPAFGPLTGYSPSSDQHDDQKG